MRTVIYSMSVSLDGFIAGPGCGDGCGGQTKSTPSGKLHAGAETERPEFVEASRRVISEERRL